MLTGRLDHFEILGPLGSGGMGDVYRARDTRLGRSVAIKVLPPEFSSDPERRVRFEREARAIAALTHPHICTLHDIGTVDGASYLVMELLDGETLAERLKRGPMSVPETLECATQVAAALAAAHRAGIVHHDLKPANVMQTRSGVKLLDFGLARQRNGTRLRPDEDTQSVALTGGGEIVGTLPYMAPEQVEGSETDTRTDVYALGLLIVEMATGRRLRNESSNGAVIAAILREPPPVLSELQPGAPRALDPIVAGCLAREPEARWTTANDVLLQLRGLRAATADETRPGGGKGRRRLPWTIAALASAAAIVMLALLLAERRSADGGGGLEVLSIVPPEGTIVERQPPQISPDGRHVAFVARGRGGQTAIYLRARDSSTARMLAGTENALMPFWSPDGQRLGFFARGQLKVTAIAGGTPLTLARTALPRGGTWGKDDAILFVPAPPLGIHRVSASGGPVTRLPTSDDQLRWFPAMLPDGRHYLFLGLTLERREGAIWVGEIDSPRATRLFESRGNAIYASSGHLLFVRDATLMAQRFDASTATLAGAPAAVAADVGVDPATHRGLFSVSQTDALSFLPNTPASQLAWYDRSGGAIDGPAPTGLSPYQGVCFSGNGTHAVFETADRVTGNTDVFAMELATGAVTRLTFDDTVDFYPICGPGDRLAFASMRSGHPRLFVTSLASPGGEKLLRETPYPLIPTDWSSEDRIVVAEQHPTRSWDIYLLSASTGTLTPIAVSDGDDRGGKLSPDGKWAAYTSFDGGAPQVFVVPVPPTGARWQVSEGGGQQALWQPDGRKLYYLAPDRTLIAVDVEGQGGTFAIGPRHVLFSTRAVTGDIPQLTCPYALTRDGTRVVVNRASEALVPLTVMANWTKALTR